jgi:NADPH:quinone reductase-like Zn-dependent oxidoreductase
MRISVGILASASVLFVFGATGMIGTWALGVATVLGLIGAICTVTIMEEREHADAIVTDLQDRRRPALSDEPFEAADLFAQG